MTSDLSCDHCNQPLGERWYVVVVVYIVVFLPWTILHAVDFIGPGWQSVRDTRRYAKQHFWWTLVPMGFIVAYIVLQILAEDYKETAMAVIALIIGLRHLLNTIWGLWQLEHFREWAVDSITTLKRFGIHFHLREGHPDRRDDESERQYHFSLADQIKINERIVDNQILYGAVSCYLVKAVKVEGKHAWKFMRNPNSAPKSFVAKMSYIYQPMQALLTAVYSQFGPFHKSVTDPAVWHQRPTEPVKVWINWATAFIGQGYEEWLRNFDVEEEPPSPSPGCVSMDNLHQAQNFYARELLSTMLLLIRKDRSNDNKSVGDPFVWLDAASDGSISLSKYGKLSKAELFKMAVETGRGLPFGAPQDELLLREAQDISDRKYSFKSYSYLVKQATGKMREEFGDHVDRLDANVLEWLTILLSLVPFEPYEPVYNTRFNRSGFYLYFSRICTSCAQYLRFLKRRNLPGDIENSNPPGLNTERAKISSTPSQPDGDGNVVYSNREIPVVNLRTQLGLEKLMPYLIRERPMWTQESNMAGTSRTDDPHFSFLSFPCHQLVKPDRLSENDNVLEVSLILDSWRALLFGDSIKAVLLKDKDMEQETRCAPLTPNLSSDVIQKRSKRLFLAHSALQKISLPDEYTCLQIDDNMRYAETIGFMGVAVEHVRSKLAESVKARRVPESEDWFPPITLGTVRYGEKSTRDLVKFEISESLSAVLNRAVRNPMELKSFNRVTELRLLSELQQACLKSINEDTTAENIMDEDSSAPSSKVLMLALVIGFPGLHFKESKRVSSTELLMTIIPSCPPQDLSVRISIALDGVVGKARAFLVSPTVDYFDWSAWRDAIGGRMYGYEQWRKSHGIQTGLLTSSEGELSSDMLLVPVHGGGGGTELYVWRTWLPFIPSICEFERKPRQKLRQNGEAEADDHLTNPQLTSLAISAVKGVHRQRQTHSID